MTREEAIRKLQKQKAEYLDEWVDYSGVAEAYDMAIEALSADAVSREECNCVFSKPKIKLPKKAVEFNFSNIEVVVRCRDCIHRDSTCGMGDHRWCKLIKMATSPKDFCSYGKRRGEDE